MTGSHSTDAEALAARIVAELHPIRAHVTGAADLAEALRRRGVAIGGPACDLAIIIPLHDAPADAARILACAPPDADLAAWLRRAATAGYAPVPSFDASGLGPNATLLAAADPPSDATLHACAGLIAARDVLRQRESNLRTATRALDHRLERHAQAQRRAIRLNTGLQDRVQIAQARLAIAQHERDVIVNSTIWRATAPLRRLLNRLPRTRRTAFGSEAATDEGLGATAYERWVASHDTLDDADRAAIHAHIAQFPDRPVISVVMPAYDTDETLLRAAIASVQNQLYPHWQLCVADDGSPGPHVARVLEHVAATDPRIRWVRCAANGNISAATNAALALAHGPFVALMDHDDLLPEHALYEVAAELAEHPDADIIYSDEDQIDASGRRTLPYFKPDWNIDLMLAHNMVSHLGVYRRALVEQVGGARIGYEGSQDYDLALRIVDATTPDRIRHIPAVLYHWRQHATSFSKERIEACVVAARRAIADHLQRTGQAATTLVRPSPWIPTWTRIQYRLLDPPPRVSIIVPTRDKPDLLRRCADGLLHRTDYPDIELIIADNDSAEPDTASLLADLQRDPRVRVLPCPGPFNYSAMNNAAAALSTGQVLALVNNDIDVIDPGWLAEMVSQALRPGIGAVGARLLFPDGAVQHAGVVLGVGSFAGGPGVAGHFSLGDAGASFGYFGASVLVHEVAAVTAACMVLRTSVWNDAGGLDAENLPVAFNDVDLCLRLRSQGLRNIWTPYAELTHHESASRGDDLAPEHRARFERECQTMRDRWAPTLDHDPFYNPNFSRLDGLFRLLGESTRRRPWM